MTLRHLQAGLSDYFDFYNHERPHQSLYWWTPADDHYVLCSELAELGWMHPISPVSWPGGRGQPYSSSGERPAPACESLPLAWHSPM